MKDNFKFFQGKLPVEWFCSQGEDGEPTVWGRGYAFINECFVQDRQFVDAVARHCQEEKEGAAVEVVKRLIPNLNGNWGLVVEWPQGYVVAATDRMRSVPLFYSWVKNSLTISPSIYPIIDKLGIKTVSEDCALEYMLAGYVTGGDTLYDEIKQIQGGEILEYTPGCNAPSPKTHRYFRFLPTGDSPADQVGVEREVEAVLDNVYSRYAKAFANRQIVVPLSGGLDSRLVVAMLRRHGVKDVLCYAYGRKNNTDAIASRQVASALDYEWEFIEYNKKNWATWMSSENMASFWRYSGQGTSVPLITGFPGIAGVVRRRKLENCVFMPGHTGDFLSGKCIQPDVYMASEPPMPSTTVDSILSHYFHLWPGFEDCLSRPRLLRLRERLEAQVSQAGHGGDGPRAALLEAWDFDNRQAKFYMNTDRWYEFFGQEWALPNWDYELTDLFLAVPENLRWKQRLYLSALTNRVFSGNQQKLADIPLEDGKSPRYRLTGRGLRLRHAARKVIDVFGLGGVERKIRQALKSPMAYRFCAESWFTAGRDPSKVALGQVMERYQVEKRLPSFLWKIIEPKLSLPVTETHGYGLLSAIVLAGLYE